MDEEQLLELKQEIEEAKTKVANLEGQQKMLMQNLKNDFGCDDLVAAEQLLISKRKKFSDLSEQVETQLKELDQEIEALQNETEDQ